jgi:probable F420-dependent oxidoreductase
MIHQDGQVGELRRFRFGTTSFEMTRSAILAQARKAESHGYDVFFMADHLFDTLGTIPALMTVADTTGLRIGTCVLCNDFRHPVVMAKDAATLDVLSDGRFELGLGAGYLPAEYEMAGIAFESGAIRFERLAEAVKIAKMAFNGQTFSYDGAHYQVRDYTPYPPPAQRPRIPLMLGGGGRRLLTLAAAEADIVSVLPASAPQGGLRTSQLSLKSLKDKVALVREAAGARRDELEINILIADAVVSTDRRAAAASFLGELDQRLPQFTIDGEVSVDDLLDSPYLAFGTEADIAEQIIRVREETGASSIGVFPHLIDAFEPVVGRLASAT